MSHTPGPWEVGNVNIVISPSGPIADCMTMNPADAALIAAAPDLFAALDRAYRFLTENYTASDMPDILPMCRDALLKAVTP